MIMTSKPNSKNLLEYNSIPNGQERISLNPWLSKTNLDSYSWLLAKHLYFKDCDNELKPGILDSCEDNITILEFSGITSYTNIKTLLHRCPNLKTLTFSNVLLNHYDTDYKRFFIIEAPELTHLRFLGLGKLTKHETHILNFFYRRVRFASLKSVSFLPGGKRQDDKKGQKSKVTLRNNFTKCSVNSSALVNFLTQNRQNLKSLVVLRPGIPLQHEKCDSSSSSSDSEPEHLKLQLQNFECDVNCLGFEKVLGSQNSLQRLICHNKRARCSVDFDIISSAVRRCAETLREFQCPQYLGPTGSGSSEELLQHDCTVYKGCQKLQRLYINVSSWYEEQSSSSTGLCKQPGAVINARFIPLSVTHLVLRFDLISQHGMELFMARVPKMNDIQFLILQGNPKTPFKVKSSWIAALAEHPKLEIFELSHCVLDDPECARDILHSRPDLRKYLKLEDYKCSLWKDSQGSPYVPETETLINNNGSV